jgi:zinc/manganese transport system ATP-binding protein
MRTDCTHLGSGNMGALVGADSTVEAAVRFEAVTVRYGNGTAVREVDAKISMGTLTALIGPNGAGKSTLLNVVMGLKDAAAGRVVLNSRIGQRIAYLPQQSALDRSFPICVLDLVMLGAWDRTHSLGRVSDIDRQRAEDALSAVGLAGLQHRPISSLSAGQFQRALFARLLMQDAQLLLLDEPFNAVDSRTTQDLLAVLKSWHQEGRTVVAVLHDLDQVRAHFSHAVLLAHRCIACGKTHSVVTAENLKLARTVAEQWALGAA